MRKIVFIAAFILFTRGVYAIDNAEIKKADELFEKATYQEALKIYQKIFKESNDPELKWKAFWRECESLTHLFRYGEAAGLLSKTEVPKDLPYKARVLLLRAELYTEFLRQYSGLTNTGDIIEEETDESVPSGNKEKKEVFSLTQDEIKQRITESFQELWKMSSYLAGMPLSKEDYYILVKDIDNGMYPTLFDYAVYRYTDYIFTFLGEIKEGQVLPEAELAVKESFNSEINFKDMPGLLAAELMEFAGLKYPEKRREARERWKIERLMIPFDYNNFFTFKDRDKTAKISEGLLLKWMDSFETKEAKGQAGYRYAYQMESRSELVKAVDICKRIEKECPGTYACRLARQMTARIEMPRMNMTAKISLPPGKGAITISTKNLKHIYFRFYSINPRVLKEATRYFYGWSGLLNSAGEEWLKQYLPKLSLKKEYKFKTGDRGDYKNITDAVDTEKLDLGPGIYLVMASNDSAFKIHSSLLCTSIINITDIMLVGTFGFKDEVEKVYYDYLEKNGTEYTESEGAHFYALDAKNGKPLPGADLSLCYYSYYEDSGNYDRHKTVELKTDDSGVINKSFKLRVVPYNSENSWQIDPLLKFGNSYAYWNSGGGFNYNPPDPIDIFIETDRPIYRPGQQVKIKVVATRHTSAGNRVLSGAEVSLTAKDCNWKEVYTAKLKLNNSGSADTGFEIPTGRLLGQYYIEARILNQKNSQMSKGIYFSVEEYKRPDFEIILDKPKDAWKYDRQSSIKGSVKYYFGGAVPDAAINYRISRTWYVPWYYRYWFYGFNPSKNEIASGTLKSDKDGNFSIPFTPAAPPESQSWKELPDMAQFYVEVDARDEGGRTITGSMNYTAGKKGVYLTIEKQKGFFFSSEEVALAIRRQTVNDTPSPGEGEFEVYRITSTQTPALNDNNDYGYRQWIPPVEVQLKDVPDGDFVKKGVVKFSSKGMADVKLDSLKPGTYRIKSKTKDDWQEEVEQSAIFVVADKDVKKAVPLYLPSVALLEKDEYSPGETARMLIGSGHCLGTYHIEIWAGEFLIYHKLIDEKLPVRLLEIPIAQKYKGGVTLRWFGVKDLRTYSNEINIPVPFKDKKLSVKLNPFKKEIKPGEKQSWGLEVKDSNNNPVSGGEALVLMYDRSLEYYQKSDNTWLNILYDPRPAPAGDINSYFGIYSHSIQVTEGLLEQLLKAFSNPEREPVPPMLRTRRTWVYGYKGAGRHGYGGGVPYETSALTVEGESMRSEDKAKKELAAPIQSSLEKNAQKPAEEPAPKKEEPKARTSFNETAIFAPHVVIGKDGKASFSFTSPEQLTGWKVKVFAFTGDVKEGTLTEETVTKKELMARADIPRFFREGDRGTVTGIVHNETDKAIKGTLTIDITEGEKSILEKVKLTGNSRAFEIQPHNIKSFDWMIDIPDGVSTYKVKVTAISGDLSDCEERELPILPSRQRLIESRFTVLTGDIMKSMKFEEMLKDDPSRINEKMTLQIDPQLALNILNSIPFLVYYPFECVEQKLNKFVPLAIMNEIYKKFPEIAESVKKIPKRNTITPPWEKDDPDRLIKLIETPWVWESEGCPISFPVIDMLDPKIVEAEKNITLEWLQSVQLSNGAFPWWPGGREDPYMTLYVLEGLAQARRYGVSVPQDMIDRALRYVNSTIPLKLKAEEQYLSLVAYAAYIVTSFPENEFSSAKEGFRCARSWVVFIDKHFNALTAFGKAYLAYTYYRLGDKQKAQTALTSAMDGSREDDIAGVYWTPEKYSWLWYNDTVEKHAFLLKTLNELRPTDPRIPGMIKWLLFNKKGNAWKSTKASAAAIYSLLDYLNSKGALSSDEVFNVKWGNIRDSAIIKPMDFLDKPLRWKLEGVDITQANAEAQIIKKGKGIAFASLTWTYTTRQLPDESAPGLLNLKRTFYLRVKEGDPGEYHLKPLKSGNKVHVGDQIEVHLKINTRSQFEYMHLKDLKAAGFEAETLLSGWKWDMLSRYEEPRDSLTNFFIDWLPHGEYILKYRMKPTKAGTYRIGAAILQSMYAPEMTAHSNGIILEVEK